MSTADTSDTWYAAYLYTAGFKLLESTVNGNRVNFHFDAEDEDPAELRSRYMGGAEINAVEYSRAYQTLRAIAMELTGRAR